MNLLKHIRLFLHIHWQQIKRKWKILPLLLLFPLFIVGAIIFMIASFFHIDEEMPLIIGVVDYDQSTETTMIVDLLEESSQFGSLLQVKSFTEEEANKNIEENKISSYITLPEDFASHLYAGNSVEMFVTGNPKQQTESNIIHELINSVMRHIQTAQANILLINEYARLTPMDDETRSELIINEFMSSFMSILGRETILSERTIENIATSSPREYFLLSIFFIINTLWLFITYHFFYREEDRRMQRRLRTYGVTQVGQITSKIFITLLSNLLLLTISLSVLYKFAKFDVHLSDIQKIVLIYILYSSGFVITLALLEFIFNDVRIRLLVHSLITLLLIILSGALVPTIYFPLYIQDILPKIPAYNALYWWQEILLNERLHIDYLPIFIYTIISLVILIGIAIVKERVGE